MCGSAGAQATGGGGRAAACPEALFAVCERDEEGMEIALGRGPPDRLHPAVGPSAVFPHYFGRPDMPYVRGLRSSGKMMMIKAVLPALETQDGGDRGAQYGHLSIATA